MIKQSLKAQISIDLVKDVVKKLKNKGFDALIHHELAIALTTIGFRQVCKQFGTQWNDKLQKEALTKLNDSQYDLSWVDNVNNPNFLPFLQLCNRGDIAKIKQFIFTVGKKSKKQLFATTDNFKRTPLHIAVKQGFDVLAEYLMNEGISIHSRDRQLKTPLHYCKNQLVCQLLLKRGANPMAKDNKNCNAAHYAASGQHSKILQMILKNKNVVNQLDSTGKTPIFYAIYNGTDQQINILRILIQNGANINIQDNTGKTPLHYAAQLGRNRCIPFLIQKQAKFDIRDKLGKTAFQLCSNEKTKKIFLAYSQGKGIPSEAQQKQKRFQFKKLSQAYVKQSNIKDSKNKDSKQSNHSNTQVFSRQTNQVAGWVREKVFVLMKKLQEGGIKAFWHLKRPYIYTGSWAQDTEGIQDLYQTFLNVNGPQAALRIFNILCPYEKSLPAVISKTEQAFQSFFGENWFSNDPIQKMKNIHATSKIRSELQLKAKQNEDLRLQLQAYRSDIDRLEMQIMKLKSQLNHYQRLQQQLRKQRTKSTQQYTQSLKYMNEISDLKQQISKLGAGQEQSSILNKIIQQLRSKNQDLKKQIYQNKVNQAAARRKCGQIFLRSLNQARNGQTKIVLQQNNLYDDDAIISLYELLQGNPPNLQKRFKLSDKRGVGKLNIQQFTNLLQNLGMIPQDVMSLHRITGFSQGRKTLSLDQFKTILQMRHKNRPMWEKQLIRKIKNIILSQNMTLDTFYTIIDVDQSGTITPSQLRQGLQKCNIFMNQTDWSNLFNLLDADKSGSIQIEQIKLIFEQESSGKLKQQPQLQQKQQQQQKQQKQVQNQQQKQPNNQEQNKNQKNEQIQQNQKEEQNQPEPEKQQNQLLSNQEEQPQQYQQKSKLQSCIVYNGDIKIQVSQIAYGSSEQPEKIWVNLKIGDFQEAVLMIKKGVKGKAGIISLKQYKVVPSQSVQLVIFFYNSKDYSEQSYLGQSKINLDSIFENPNQYAINDDVSLEASTYQKQVDINFKLQVKWQPKEIQ